jgi:YVTN family beta-propeller protein
MIRSFFAALISILILGSAPSSAQNAYITNNGDNTVSVIDTATNTVVGLPIPVGSAPYGVAVTSDGSKVYVTGAYGVAVIDTATDAVTATIPVETMYCQGPGAGGVAVSPDGSKVYVTKYCPPFTSFSVIDTASNSMTATIQQMPPEVAFGILSLRTAARFMSRHLRVPWR